ncbi:MAG: hypothetical protein EAX87_12905 [Candidatus Thorarchaeota archaeon]|nr:hypothetical protein [Candidatus Thorarchaeota archaeon]
MVIRKNGALIPFGGLCLSAALLIDRFAGTGTLVDFLVGLLTGLAIVLNLVGLYRSRRHA